MALRSVRESTKRKSEISTSRTPSSSSASSRKKAKQHDQAQSKDNAISKPAAEETATPSNALQIEEETGDIFAAPPNALIIHACNCRGSWGAGIAKAFKDRYPKAYLEYVRHCEEHGDKLLDLAQLISPVDAQEETSGDDHEPIAEQGKDDGKRIPRHFVGCLYTSRDYGKNKDSPSRILAATKPAMEDLIKQVKDWNAHAEAADKVGEVRMCKINSGLFAVPWDRTKDVLQSIDAGQNDVKIVKVVSPPG